MKRVTGLGGIFFKTKDPAAARAWYEKHLGMTMDDYGHTFFWRPMDQPQHRARTQWCAFDAATKYFSPSEKPFMINYRVADLEGLLAQLREEGVEIAGEMEVYEYGKFAWIMDPDGHKIELWEPVDEALDQFEGSE